MNDQMHMPRGCNSSGSPKNVREAGTVPPPSPALKLVPPPCRKLAVRACAPSLDPALLAFVMRAVFAGEGGAAGKGREFPCEVLYLGRNDEELARRSFGHLGEGLQVEIAQ